MGKYKAVISDIDGTLTILSPTAYPTDRVVKTIKAIHKKGVCFSLATGRPFFMIEYLIKHLGLNSPMITDNGAVIINAKDRSVMWEAVLPNEEASEILKLTKKYQLTRLSCDVANFENPKKIPSNVKIRKMSVHGLTEKQAEDLVKNIRVNFKNLAVDKTAAYEGKQYLDVYISHADATKQYAVLKYAQILGISTKEIVGIGDHYNDFPLLMACGLKIAMGNAVKDLKEIADYIAPPVEEDGLAQALEKYLL